MGKLRSLVRVNEWLFSKIPSLFVPLLLFYYYEGASGDCTKVLFLYFIYLMFSFSFGYAVNDYSDREEDAIVGKRNIMGELSETQCSLILLILLCGCIPFGIICNNPVIIPIYIFVYFWGAAYSIRPFRFKERGALGLFECAIAQRMFPMFPILAYSLKTTRYVILWGSITFFAGMRYILIHQVLDLENDRRSGTRTFTTEHENETRYLIYAFFLGETVLLIVTAILAFPLNVVIRFGLLYLVIMGLTFFTVHYIYHSPWLLSYTAVPYEDLYNFYFPLFLLVAITQKASGAFVAVLILCMIGFHPMLNKWKIMAFGFRRILEGALWNK